MTKISHGVTAPRGFLASGVSSGLKGRRPDLALILSEVPAVAAGVLTINRLAAHPVRLTRQSLGTGKAQAILANSGNANCCTGPQGLQDARQMREITARLLGLSPESVLVASTGVIGRRLPLRRVLKALPKLVHGLSRRGGKSAAQAILTTDLVTKSAAATARIQGRRITIGGIAKGSGMIDPAMATMLGFLTTDCAVTLPGLRQALRQATESSFNRITIDGQMSTNDTVLLLANAAAGNRPLAPGAPGWAAFQEALESVTAQLARAIVQDGEGASRLIQVAVSGGATEREALRVAKAIANAPLIKTMVAGADPNWGRVAATVGAVGIPVHPGRVAIGLSGIVVFRQGTPLQVNRLLLKERFRKPEVSIEVNLNRGRGKARVLSCDLTHGYIDINAKYS